MRPAARQPGPAPERLQQVPPGRIEPNPGQPRRHFPPGQLERLAQSLASQGVIQPLVVRPHPHESGRYQLVAGERRLRAAQHLGWSEVPVLVRAVPDEALLEAALVENLQREPLTPTEEAGAYRALLEGHGYTQETLAARVGRDRSTIANMVRLLALPPGVLEDLDAGRLTIGHARALLGVAQPDQQVALHRVVVERGLSVRATERLVQRERRRGSAAGAGAESAAGRGPEHGPAVPEGGLAPAQALQFQAVQEMLERRLGTRVAIRHAPGAGDGPGRIEIEYYSLDDFNRLYELLAR